jgi:hypothetical protein
LPAAEKLPKSGGEYIAEEQSTNKAMNLTIRFDEQTLVELRKIAGGKGMGVTTLVRMWTLERLQKEKTEH